MTATILYVPNQNLQLGESYPMLSCKHVVDEMFVSDLCVLSHIMESHKNKNQYTAMTIFCETLTNMNVPYKIND